MRVIETQNGSLAEQGRPFSNAAVTFMSHGGALGHVSFVPFLSSWVDVTPWLRPDLRVYMDATMSDMYAWNVAQHYLSPNGIQYYKFLRLRERSMIENLMRWNPRMDRARAVEAFEMLLNVSSKEEYYWLKDFFNI